MRVHILTGDIGGTNTRLATVAYSDSRVQAIDGHTFSSPAYASLNDIVGEFLDARPDFQPTAAAFGVAGPVVRGVCRVTNLPWVVDGAALAERLRLEQAHVLNDLEALAWGIDILQPDETVSLQLGAADARGNRAVIAAGTGLGEAGVFFDGRYHVPFATEGGHAEFAAATERDWQLHGFLERRFGHVSWERVVSGPGLVHLFEFLLDDAGRATPDWLRDPAQDGAAAITRRALSETDPLCVETLDWFARLYGAEAGNLALKMNARGGVYLGGGIAPKVLSALQKGAFLAGFLDKGRMRDLVEAMPVRVIRNEAITLHGLARFAALHTR
jgi:glucokinase